MKLFKARTIWLPTWQGWLIILFIFVGFLLTAMLNVHRFLAPTKRVADADILIMEAWVPVTVRNATAGEFLGGGYRLLVIPDLVENDDLKGSSQEGRIVAAVNSIVSMGVPQDRIIECVDTATDNHRSATMADVALDTLRQKGIKAKGINVIAPAAHARKTWLVYRRVLASEAMVGIVAVPTGDYDPSTWWRSTAGAKWVIANGIGWLYELIAGQ